MIWVLLAAAAMAPLRSGPASCGAENAAARRRMVRDQVRFRGVSDPAVLSAMERVPRHCFVPPEYRDLAYADMPLPIGHGQTVSQPYVVARMTELLELTPRDRVLEIGTGSGYQAAVLAEIASRVYTVEILPDLARRARERLASLGYGNVEVRVGDGRKGWPEAAPFDAILVTAAAAEPPPALLRQLKEGGRLCMPVGPPGGVQSLVVITKSAAGLERRTVMPVRFVPLKGE